MSRHYRIITLTVESRSYFYNVLNRSIYDCGEPSCATINPNHRAKLKLDTRAIYLDV